MFETIFNDCEKGFVRELISHSQYQFYPNRKDKNYDPNTDSLPDIIIESG